MRWIGWIIAALLLVGSVAEDLPPVVASKGTAASDLWRRTSDGWERAQWLVPPRTISPWLHPALLAAFQATLSVAALRTLAPRTVSMPRSSASCM